MITDFSIDIDKSKEIPSVNIQGEIDIYTCTELRKNLNDIMENDPKNFILNLEKVQYIDSTGLGTIAHSAQKIQSNDGSVYVICSKPQIKKIFEVSGLLQKNIKLFESFDQMETTTNG